MQHHQLFYRKVRVEQYNQPMLISTLNEGLVDMKATVLTNVGSVLVGV
jgi:hypothetical protein